MDAVSVTVANMLVFGALALCAGVYFVPTVVALKRNVNVGPALVINLFLGWTLLGWVGALALALAARPVAPVVIVPQPPTDPLARSASQEISAAADAGVTNRHGA